MEEATYTLKFSDQKWSVFGARGVWPQKYLENIIKSIF